MEGSGYWMSSPARLAQQTRRTLSGTINRRLRNRDWQERNRVYVGPMYIFLTALRVHLRIVEKEDKERTKGGEKRRSVTSEKRSGYIETEKYIGTERVRQHVTEEMRLSRVTCRAALYVS